ncbi:MAG: ATP-dependent DNA helicase, partial [Rhodospirillales bacterium]|nr:ATP-dependent DNA helicase [Rhodospirillales bacterium]
LTFGNPAEAAALGLVARWLLATRDGDMVGGDFPGWLVELVGRMRTLGLTDRRGECIHAACPHYTRCFIERTVRRARRAEIVVANHALVMMQAALGGLDDDTQPTRYVFDEGHHLFEAADGAFAAHLCGFEAAELRRWLLGAEGDGMRSRARGLKRRAEDVVGHSETAVLALDQAMQAAKVLPGPSWQHRLCETKGESHGACEDFLALVRDQVLARAQDPDSPYSLEAETEPLLPGLLEAAAHLERAFHKLADPLKVLATSLHDLLADEAAELDTAIRQRIESICRGIERRALLPLTAWRAMLDSLIGSEPDARTVDWFQIERQDGRAVDISFHRHWRDPTLPFVRAVVEPAHGLLITSATLRDGSGDGEA